MAFEFKDITTDEGPNRWGLLLGSLWEGKPVRFHLLTNVRFSFANIHLGEYLRTRIVSVSREKDARIGAIESWWIRGELLSPGEGLPLGIMIEGSYDTQDRGGKFTLTERGYHGGDYFFGWRNGVQAAGNLLRPSDVVRVSRE